MTKTTKDGEKTTTIADETPQRWGPILRKMKEARKDWLKRPPAKEVLVTTITDLIAQVEAMAKEEPAAATMESVDKASIKEIISEALQGFNGRLTSIDQELGKLKEYHVRAEQKSGARTYSKVAAAAGPMASQSLPTVVVQVDVEEGEQPTAAELLTKIRKAIPEAKAVKPNHRVAGRADVVLQTQTRREQVLATGLEADTGVRLIRKPLQVLLLGVPLDYGITVGASAENTQFLKELNKANSTTFTQVKWLYNARKLEELRKNSERTRGSAVLSTFSQADQVKAVTRGLTQGALFFETKYWSQEVTRVQCFRCWKWGHTQSACNQKEDTCGHCAGSHSTKACETKGIAQASCAACKKKGHFAWMTSQCEAFERYTGVLREREAELRRATHEARGTVERPSAGTETDTEEEFTVVTNKRKRRAGGPLLGRPSFLKIAGQDTRQAKFTFKAAGGGGTGTPNDSEKGERDSRASSPMDTTDSTPTPSL